jgi:predicted dehydrogenase
MWSNLSKFVPGTKKGVRCDTCPEPCEDRNVTVRGGVTNSTPDGLGEDGTFSNGCFYNTPKDIGDSYVGMMEYASGLRGIVDMCFFPSSPYGRSFDIVGSEGEIRGNIYERRVELYRRVGGAEHTVFDLKAVSEGPHFGGDWRQVVRFLEAIRGENEGLATGIDGMRAVAVGSAMERSIKEDRQVLLAEVMATGQGNWLSRSGSRHML